MAFHMAKSAKNREFLYFLAPGFGDHLPFEDLGHEKKQQQPPTKPSTADLQTETFSDGDPTGATGVGLQALNRFCFGHVCLDSLDPRKLLDAMSINW
jgi:hypothetical protein